MTTPQPKTRTAPVLDEKEVAAYLEANPDFFSRQPQVLQTLRLPDARGSGSTISLIERQVEVMRDRNRQLDTRLAELMEVGRGNDALGERIHKLVRRLVGARSAAATVEAIETSLREDFGLRQAVLVLFGDHPALKAAESRFLRLVPRETPELKTFDSLFASGKPRCGQVRDSQRDFLFGAGAVDVGSAALVPLGANGALGILACGSTDAEHFNPSMSTDYLARIADLLAVALTAS